MQYQVRDVDGDGFRALPGDPTVAPPLPVLRLMVSALAMFVLILVAGLVVAATAPRLIGYRSVVVASGSMEPAIRVADVVVTSPSDGVGLAEGAIINFEYGEGTRLHRIAAVTTQGYRTSGDANGVTDSDTVVPSDVRGVGIVVVPFVGLPARWVEEGRWLQLGATLVALVGALYLSRARWTEAAADWGRS
ncbi:MAG: signal peptidase I [Actinomycetia bacterium]|nr:signal peptidase I [Actinomycetes bacterium]